MVSSLVRKGKVERATRMVLRAMCVFCGDERQEG